MRFLAPTHLGLLLGVAGLVALYIVLQRRRRHYAVRFTNLELLDSVAPRRPGWRRHVAAGAMAVGLAALVVALARPVREEQVPKDEAVIMLVVDTSASMEAVDVAPSRIAAAKSAAADFVAGLPDGFQVGLIAYDTTVRVVSSPTTDHASVQEAIDGLTTGPGTASGDALTTALSVLSSATTATDPDLSAGAANAPSTTIVLVSDGASTVGSPVETAAQAAAEQDVPVTTIAYGTDSGTVVVDGQTIPVPADQASMEAVATTTGGEYFAAASAAELDQVYETIQKRVGYELEEREILRTFLGLGLVALIVAAAASMVWTARLF